MATTTLEKTSPLEFIRELLTQQDDVLRIIRLEAHGSRIRYQIETPFKTFPRFVIGECDGNGDNVRLLHRCGLIETSDAGWNDNEEGVIQ